VSALRSSTLRGVALSALTLAVLTAARAALYDRLGPQPPFLLFFVPILLGAWIGGLPAGLAATAAAALVGEFAFAEPRFALDVPVGREAVAVTWFVVQGVILSLVTARAGADRRRALVGARDERAVVDKLQAVLDGVDDAIAVQDATGRVLYANEVAARLLGVASVDALLHASTPAAIAGHLEVLDEERRAVPGDQMPGRLALRTGAPVERVLVFRVRATAQERWTVVRSKPLFDADGQPSSVISVLQDVTQHRRDEARRAFIARASQRLSASLDYPQTLDEVVRLAVPEVADWAALDLVKDGRAQRLAVAHVDPAKTALVAELERRFPPDPDAPSGVPNVLRTGRPELVPEIPDEALAAEARDPEHLALVRELGLRSYLGVPLTARGATIGVLSFAVAGSGRRFGPEDLALAASLAERASVAIEHARLFREAERARADAELANRSKDEFLAMLGHELRNPLAPILTALALIRMRAGQWPERELAVIERQVKHLVRLVDDLLDVSRITRGRVELKLERLSLAEVVARAVEMSLPLIEQRAQGLDVDVPAELTVRGDAVRLAQVVANLLNNAAKYSNKGGRIGVSAARVGDRVELRVRDRGIGIAPEMLPRVFDLFAQESQAIDRAAGGLGLGLAIVRSLVALHGGDVSAASDGAGAGSEFCVRLPALDEAAAPTVAPGSGPAGPPRSARVLVVDDNEDAADLLVDALAAMGHDARKAHDGPTALVAAAAHRPTIALLDIGLPVMDGYELGRRLRAMDGLADVRLVAVTGYGQAADRRRSMEAGFDAHLVKPVDLEALGALIARLALA
jgi:PAS domain S-box-containing protein